VEGWFPGGGHDVEATVFAGEVFEFGDGSFEGDGVSDCVAGQGVPKFDFVVLAAGSEDFAVGGEGEGKHVAGVTESVEFFAARDFPESGGAVPTGGGE